jgi:hypothetical protein
MAAHRFTEQLKEYVLRLSLFRGCFMAARYYYRPALSSR